MQELLDQTFNISERDAPGSARCAAISPQRIELVSPFVHSAFDTAILWRKGRATIMLRARAAYDGR
jgi:hypothetical protein